MTKIIDRGLDLWIDGAVDDIAEADGEVSRIAMDEKAIK